MNFFLTLPGAGDIVGGLHTHKRVYLHAESLLDAERHGAGEVALPLARPALRNNGNSSNVDPKIRHEDARPRMFHGTQRSVHCC
jgi:hypothetical protein